MKFQDGRLFLSNFSNPFSLLWKAEEKERILVDDSTSSEVGKTISHSIWHLLNISSPTRRRPPSYFRRRGSVGEKDVFSLKYRPRSVNLVETPAIFPGIYEQHFPFIEKWNSWNPPALFDAVSLPSFWSLKTVFSSLFKRVLRTLALKNV